MSERLKQSEHMIFFWEQDHFVCDLYMVHEQRSIDIQFIPILQWFSDWKDLSSVLPLASDLKVSEKDLLEIVNQFTEANLLIREHSQEHELESRAKIWDSWGKAAEYFYYHTRLLHTDVITSDKEHHDQLKNKIGEGDRPPSLYKKVIGESVVPLPLPYTVSDQTFFNLLKERQTDRSFHSESLSLRQLATLLYYVWGAKSCNLDQGLGKSLNKTSPSGGGRHSIEAYVCVLNVQGLEPGIYHYSVKDHSLTLVKSGRFYNEVVNMAGNQSYVQEASVLFFYTACIERTMWKYQHPRNLRVIMMDLGHLSQTLYLVANSIGLGAFFCGTNNDQYIEEELNLDPIQELVLGISGVGVVKRKEDLSISPDGGGVINNA